MRAHVSRLPRLGLSFLSGSGKAVPERLQLLAIMYTDLVGYAAQTQQNESLALQALDLHRTLRRPMFRKHGGEESPQGKRRGDAFLVEFRSAATALRCAMDIQKILLD
jgi:class 3 adenylate cyclase